MVAIVTSTVDPETVWQVSSGPMTRAERDAVPDDGRRHELIDGVLVVTPSPGHSHQTAVVGLIVALVGTCPPELQVLTDPSDVVLSENTIVEPDVLVASRKDFTPRDLPKPPLLAVEMLSPSTRRIDLTLKRVRYEAAGVLSYWVVDPDVPSITAWELRDGAYVLAGEASDDDSLTLELPFPVTITPSELLNGRRH